MFCINCGKRIEDSGKFCPYCGAEIPESITRELAHAHSADSVSHDGTALPEANLPAAPATSNSTAVPPANRKKSGKRWILVTAGFALVIAAAAILFFTNRKTGDYWPKAAPDAQTVESAIWKYDSNAIDGLSVISVSPSGKYILAADQVKLNVSQINAAGIPNSFGRLPDCLFIYTNQNGVYTQTGSIKIDVASNLELSSTLGVCRENGVAWSADEQCAVLTVGTNNRQTIGTTHSNLYLADFSKQTFQKLTGASDAGQQNLLPQWADSDTIRFIRWVKDADKGFIAKLMSISLKTGKEALLSDLSGSAKNTFIDDYKVSGESVYFSRDCLDLKDTGFYKAQLDGGKAPPTCLLNLWDIRTNNTQPYAQLFSSVQISSDGRWACLTALDQRLAARDIPTADDPVKPQSDPNSAKSSITGKAWVPCHDVLLYDLKSSKLVDPFVDHALRPDVVIATAATFAPDGKSLLCAVFGDGGKWTMECFSKTALYQIRLDDGSFKAVKIFKTDVLTTPNRLTWLENNAVLIRTWEGIPPGNPVQIMMPAAFKRFAG